MIVLYFLAKKRIDYEKIFMIYRMFYRIISGE